MSILEQVSKDRLLSDYSGEGLQAIEHKHRYFIKLVEYRPEFSINIDKAFLQSEHGSNRWDYYLYAEKYLSSAAVFFEPHSCTTNEVTCIILKYKWLQDKLKNHLSLLVPANTKKLYFWIPTSGNKIIKSSPQFRQLSKTKIRIINIIIDKALD